mgnify:CR=1 FL=1
MTRLEELRKQRHELNQQIRELEKGYPIINGKAKLDRQEYPTDKPDRYHISIKVEPIDPPEMNSPWGRKGYCWRTVANGGTREEVIKQIPEIIKDLQGLHDELVGGQDGEG